MTSRCVCNTTKSSNPSSSDRSEGDKPRQQPEGDPSKDDQISVSRTNLSKVKLGLQGEKIIVIKTTQTEQENNGQPKKPIRRVNRWSTKVRGKLPRS